jgi:hypothetical protein
VNLNGHGNRDEFDSNDIDSLLESAYQDLLDQVRGSVDPAASLDEIMSVAVDAPCDRLDGDDGRNAPGSGSQEALYANEAVDPDLTFVLCFGDALDRALDTALDLMLALARDPGADHAAALTKALICDVTLARDFEPTLASARQIDFALDLATPSDLDGDLDRADKLDWARVVARARFLDFARVFALGLIRTLEAEPGPALDLARQVAELLATASDVGLRRAMIRNFKEIHYIDATGRDLSWLDASGTPVPVGTIWDEQTILPPAQAAKVEAHSISIGWGRRKLQTT